MSNAKPALVLLILLLTAGAASATIIDDIRNALRPMSLTNFQAPSMTIPAGTDFSVTYTLTDSIQTDGAPSHKHTLNYDVFVTPEQPYFGNKRDYTTATENGVLWVLSAPEIWLNAGESKTITTTIEGSKVPGKYKYMITTAVWVGGKFTTDTSPSNTGYFYVTFTEPLKTNPVPTSAPTPAQTLAPSAPTSAPTSVPTLVPAPAPSPTNQPSNPPVGNPAKSAIDRIIAWLKSLFPIRF